MSKNIYSQVKLSRPNYSVFDLGYENAFTSPFGYLIPTYVEDCIPGDTFTLGNSCLIRMNPLKAPFMGRISAKFYTFFVPYRILWRDWEDFITGGREGTKKPPMPLVTGDSSRMSFTPRLHDFLSRVRSSVGADGTQTFIAPQGGSNFLEFVAVWKIWNDYFRDQNLCEDIFPDPLYLGMPISEKGLSINASGYLNYGTKFADNVGISSNGDCPLKAWDKDLFTSALPWAQRGDVVRIPVGSSSRVFYTQNTSPKKTYPMDAIANNGLIALNVAETPSGNGYLSLNSGADMGISVEDLRTANALQRWLERNAIGGGRYVEQILSHFGVRVPDYRLDRPEFIQGHRVVISSSKVAQTSETQETPLGTLGGEGSGSGSSRLSTYHVKEHGCFIRLMCILPDAVYSQGVPRRALKFDKLDYFFPEFENLGEQEIYNAELYVSGNTDDLSEFGYGPRYYEYKDRVNEVHGEFRTRLKYWVPQRQFSTLPGLNNDFVQVNPVKEKSLNNIFAVETNDYSQFQILCYNYAKAVRPMSKWSRFNF